MLSILAIGALIASTTNNTAGMIPPTVEIAPGVEMYRISLGTCCGSLPSVGLGPWLAAGGQGIDTAYDYGKNVPGGKQESVASVLASTGTKRTDVFITSKIPAGLDPTGRQCRSGDPQVALATVKENLRELKIDYLDLVGTTFLRLHTPQRRALSHLSQNMRLQSPEAQTLHTRPV